MTPNQRIKLLIILGPTASGKSDLAVKMAEWIGADKIGGFKDAEIISADSRQVYKGLDIGTGKITTEEMHGIPHHCLDIADPHERFTVTDWKVAAEKAVADIVARGNLPIICGGTGFYISALINNLEFPDIDLDENELKELESKDIAALFEELIALDQRRAADMEATGDNKNKRRVIRAILIARKFGKVPPLSSKLNNPAVSKYDVLEIGISIPDEKLKERIRTRLIKRLDSGMIEEAQKLHAGGLSYERLDELGLEYRYLAKYLKGELNREQLIETLATKIWQYARRQKTWFKRDEQIKWFEVTQVQEIESIVKTFLG